MLFGSAALFAIIVSGGVFSSVRPSPCSWAGSDGCGRPLAAARLPGLDLRRIAQPPSTTDLLRADVQHWKLPLEVKSVKVCGAGGFGVFAPISEDAAVGVSTTSFKTGPHERALQVVAGIRIKF